MGGLPRRASQINEGSKEGNGPVLLVDTGNLLFKKTGLPGDRERLTAGAISEIYRDMDYAAIAVGPLDLAAGIDFLVKDASLPWLSANLLDQESRPIFPGEKIITRRDLSIGLIGLTGKIDEPAEDFQLVDWQGVLPEILERLQASCDILVVLSSLSEADNRELLQRFPQVHVLLTADRQKGNIAPTLDNHTLTAQTANQGRYLGILDLFWIPATDVTGKALTPGLVTLGSGPRQIWANFAGEAIPLAKNLPEDPVIAAKVKEMSERIRQHKP